MSITKTQIEKYLQYKEEAAKLKETEIEMRALLVKDCIEYLGASFDKIKKKIKLNLFGYKISGEIPTNYTLNKEELEKYVIFGLFPTQSSDITAEEIDCLDVKITLNESRFKKFKDSKGKDFASTILCDLVTEKDGMAQVKIEGGEE